MKATLNYVEIFPLKIIDLNSRVFLLLKNKYYTYYYQFKKIEIYIYINIFIFKRLSDFLLKALFKQSICNF